MRGAREGTANHRLWRAIRRAALWQPPAPFIHPGIAPGGLAAERGITKQGPRRAKPRPDSHSAGHLIEGSSNWWEIWW